MSTTDAPALVPIHLRRFSPLPAEERSNKVRPLSARLATGRWREHREAAEFIDAYCSGHGDAIDTLVRSLLHYRDHLVAQGLLPAPAEEAPQLFATPDAPAGKRTATRRTAAAASGRRSRT